MDGSMEQLHAEKARALREQRGGLMQRQETLTQMLEQVSDALDVLGHRLEPVLVPEGPVPATPRAQTPPEDSALASFLANVTERTDTLLRRVQDLAGRVDL
jgi:hypothetical protein